MYSFDANKHKPVIRDVIYLSNLPQRVLKPNEDYEAFLKAADSGEDNQELFLYLSSLDFETLKIIKALMIVGRDEFSHDFKAFQAQLVKDYEDYEWRRWNDLRGYLGTQHRALFLYLKQGCQKAGIEL